MSTGVDYEQRRIYLTGGIDTVAAHRFLIALAKLDATHGDITVVVCSGGGEESAGYAIYDAILMAQNNVIMEGYGGVMSIAAAIFQAGDVRKMSPNCDFMIHNGSIPIGEDVQQNTIVEMAGQIQKNNKRYHTILANASKLSYSQVEDACAKDTFYTAEEALAAGFCDEIIAPAKKKPTRKRKRRKTKKTP
jgi:ATP-dependent Clp protease protease subunit